MISKIRAAALCALTLALSVPASAQNLSLRAPPWAQPLIASDIIPTTGGRAALAADGITIAVRVTLAPLRGGIARVIRYELHSDATNLLAVHRFTGHPTTGWWLWGPDAPRITSLTAAQRNEVGTLARGAMGIGGSLGNASDACTDGEQAFVELAVDGRSTTAGRACITNTDPVGQLALRLSELAGSRTEEELANAAVSELMDADRAFATKARADGVPAAFTAFAADNAIMLSKANITTGRAAVTARFANWPAGARLEWAPETARVSARGDMGWTWGNSVRIAADGTRTTGRYMTIWTRNEEDGAWRFSFDAAVE